MNASQAGRAAQVIQGAPAGQHVQSMSSAIPFKRDAAPGDSVLASSGAGILIVSLIAIAVVVVVRKRLHLGRSREDALPLMQVLETRRLGPRALLSVVEFDNVRYLLAHGEHGVSCIASTPTGATA